MPRRRNKKMNGGFWPFDSTSSGYGNSSYGSSTSGMFGNLFGNSRRNYGTSNSGSGIFGNLFGSSYGNTGYNGSSGYGNTGYNGSSGYGNSYGNSYGNTGYGSQPRYGGKTKRRRMKGGYKDNTPTTGLATNAAPFSGQTAKPHNWVGGKSRKRRSGIRKYKR